MSGASGLIGAAVGIGLSYTNQNYSPTMGGTFATLGDVTFTVVGSPTDMEVVNRFYYAKTDVVEQAPVLQWIYDDLTFIRMNILLHYIWCTPQAVIVAFQQMAQSHVPQPLSVGPVNYGNYFIQLIEEKDIWRADDGNLLVARLRMELIQFIGQQQTTPANIPGASTATAGSSAVYAPMPQPQVPTQNFEGVSLQDAVRMGGNAITLAGDL